METTLRTTSLPATPRGRTEARVRPNPLRAESVVKVTAEFAAVIRESALKDQYKDFDNTRHTITVLDAHNSFLNYLKKVLPIKRTDYLIPQGSPNQGKYNCCKILEKVCNSPILDPADKKEKWRIIVRNLTEIDGTAYHVRNRPPANQLPSPTVTPTVREYEPAPINRQREEKREAVIRRNLERFFTAADENLKSLFEVKKFDWPAEKPTNQNRWEFRDSPTAEPDSSEPPAKKQKSDRDEEKPCSSSDSVSTEGDSKESLSDDDMCIICMERPRTHAFLHYGLSNQDVTSHFVACRDCSNNCRWADQGCPCCRTPVINVIRILK